MKRNYTYILRCADGTFYTGWTTDLEKRLKAHNGEGPNGAKYTKTRRPVELVYSQAFDTKQEAQRFEYAVKQLKKSEKVTLIQGREAEKQIVLDRLQRDMELRSRKRTSKNNTRNTMKSGHLFYLMGKSASGKDHIYEQLLDHKDLNLKPIVPWTTRPMREGEQDGVEYHFTDEAGLEKLQQAGKVIELRTYETVHGPWNYFTVDDEHIDLEHQSYLAIGTLESYVKIRDYYGQEKVVPLFIEVEDGIRLERALKREHKQDPPKYAEMCRRFLADSEDFAADKLEAAGVHKLYHNEGELEDCINELVDAIRNA